MILKSIMKNSKECQNCFKNKKMYKAVYKVHSCASDSKLLIFILFTLTSFVA